MLKKKNPVILLPCGLLLTARARRGRVNILQLISQLPLSQGILITAVVHCSAFSPFHKFHYPPQLSCGVIDYTVSAQPSFSIHSTQTHTHTIHHRKDITFICILLFSLFVGFCISIFLTQHGYDLNIISMKNLR